MAGMATGPRSLREGEMVIIKTVSREEEIVYVNPDLVQAFDAGDGMLYLNGAGLHIHPDCIEQFAKALEARADCVVKADARRER